MATVQDTGVKPALLFMPDISGFTQFVNENEILHSQHIIQELLEILVESNQLNMEVGEIEGDAVFFYRLGEKPSAKELLKQVETMYVKFHQHLSLYDHQRFCNCSACKSVANLTLKVVAHYGEVTKYAVKEHKKIFGKDVIVIHRLLKNSLGQNEYVLMTDQLVKADEDINDPSWVTMKRGMETYDAGEVQFGYSILSKLRNQLPPPEFPQLKLHKSTFVAFTEEGIIDTDAQTVFFAILDLEQRSAWMDGVRSIEIKDHHTLNRPGTKHKCIVGDKNNPIIVTESVTIENGVAELIEMTDNGMGGCRYKVQQLEPGKTKLTVEVLVKKNPIIRLMFNLVMKKKMKKKFKQSVENLKTYCVSNPVLTEETPATEPVQ